MPIILVRVKLQKYLEQDLDSAHQEMKVVIKILELEEEWQYNPHLDSELVVHQEAAQEVDQEWQYNYHLDLELEVKVDQVWQYNHHLDLELEVQVDQEWQYNQPLDLEQELQEAELD